MTGKTVNTVQKRKTRQADNTARKQPAPDDEARRTAYIVSGEGTDAEIAERCAAVIPGWADQGDKVRQETIRLMRAFWDHKPAPLLGVTTDEHGRRLLAPPAGSNVTLNTLRTIEAFGTSSEAFSNERQYELSRHFSTDNDASAQSKLSAGLAFISGAKAEDPVQSALAVQMVATHDAAMQALRRTANAEYTEQAHVFGNLATKLLNAYTRQAEVLAKLQRGGEQVIKHIHIDNRGGQAVVADQVVTGGSRGENRDQPHAQGALGAALLGHDPNGLGVPIAGNDREEALSHARRGVAGSA